MKKHFSKFFIYPLIMASFFLFCFKVNAIDYELYSNAIDFVNSENFNAILQVAESKSELENKPYFIIDGPSNLNYINIWLFSSVNGNFYLRQTTSNKYFFSMPVTAHDYYVVSLSNINNPTLWAYEMTRYDINIDYTDSSFNYTLLYSNFEIESNNIDITLYYNNNPFPIVTENSRLLTVYDIVNNNTSSNIHEEEEIILLDFYTTIGSKITWLGEQLSSNYIYLSILGVFILIFLIELIRRYLL